MKLYNYAGGTTYNIFDIEDGTTIIEIQDESGISHSHCDTALCADVLSAMKEKKDGTVCKHEGFFKITLQPA